MLSIKATPIGACPLRSNLAFGLIASLPLIRFGATIGALCNDHPLKMSCAVR
jgi:hypothetical protein